MHVIAATLRCGSGFRGFTPLQPVLLAALLAVLLTVAALLVLHLSTSSERQSSPQEPEGSTPASSSQPAEEQLESPEAEQPPVDVKVEPGRVHARFCSSYKLEISSEDAVLSEGASKLANVTVELLSAFGRCASQPEASVEVAVEGGYLSITVRLPHPDPCAGVEVVGYEARESSLVVELRLTRVGEICAQCLGVVEAKLRVGPAVPAKYTICLKPSC